MKKVQREKILDLLKAQDWVCVEEMTKLFIVDYRRRLKDLEELGHILESRKCEKHSYHDGGSKEWRLVNKPPKIEYRQEMRDGVPTMVRYIVPVTPQKPLGQEELRVVGIWAEKSPWTGEPTGVLHEIYD